jgi:DNA-binding transcriptional MerR regulator
MISEGLMMKDRNRRTPRPENVFWVDDSRPEEVSASAGMVLSLSKVAAMFGVSRLQLRYFEFLGLIKRRYGFGTGRVYGWADCERIVCIVKARRAGIKLRDIAPVIRATNLALPAYELRRGLTKCLALIDVLAKRQQAHDHALSELQHICALLTAELDSSDPK